MCVVNVDVHILVVNFAIDSLRHFTFKSVEIISNLYLYCYISFKWYL